MAAAKTETDNALVEVVHNVKKSVDVAKAYVEGKAVVFENGVAKVTQEVAKALKDAGIVK